MCKDCLIAMRTLPIKIIRKVFLNTVFHFPIIFYLFKLSHNRYKIQLMFTLVQISKKIVIKFNHTLSIIIREWSEIVNNNRDNKNYNNYYNCIDNSLEIENSAIYLWTEIMWFNSDIILLAIVTKLYMVYFKSVV